jgi:Holliday junction resolvasome RuvABC ATP-dependent DNA helicase subunit
VDFRPYSVEELGQIIELVASEISFGEGVLSEIAETTRGNARSAVMRTKEIMLYCERSNQNTYSLTDWKKMCGILDIKPMGLSNLEVELLQILQERGNCSLQMLSAVTGMSRTAIQKEAELYLLKRGLMKINGQREISGKGMNVLEKI